MSHTTCQNCGYGWEYGGQSEHYCTCPRCKSSVEVGREGDTEGDENGSTADAEAGGVLAEDVEMLEKEVSEIHDIIGSMSDSFEDRQREVEGQVSDHGDRLDELGAAIEEIASVQVQLLEAMGGGVEYDHVDVENDEEEVSVVDAVEAYDPTEEFE